MIEIIKVVAFLLWVNCLPSLATVLLGNQFPYPVDGDRLWLDGKPVFGKNKTIRGIVVSIVGSMAFYPIMGLEFWVLLLAAMLAMAGDLSSSFIKRRSNFHSGKNIFGLDQLFEALFPLLFLQTFFVISGLSFLIVLVVFTLTAYFSSSAWLYIVDRPIPEGYPRVVSSGVRFREWRACHIPLARYQTWLNPTSVLSDQIILTWLFKITGLYAKGVENALDFQLIEKEFFFTDLPENFDGYTIVFLADLHLDGLEGIETRIATLLDKVEADLCLVGGDIRMKIYGDTETCMKRLRWLMGRKSFADGVIGVLGNHDCIEMLPDLEDAGVVMLVNDNWPVDRGGQRIWIMGVDDPHYYRLDDAQEASEDVPQQEFSIFLAHSPESYESAAGVGANLYLCGHTHGGQVCLSNGRPLFTNSRAPRFTAAGQWNHGTMTGYTSCGVGASSIPVRFNCPGEVTCITLRREE